MKEIEAKAWIFPEDEERIDRFLVSESKKIGKIEKYDRYFSLLGENEVVFRVRREGTTGKKAIITQKIRAYSERGVEINEENEFLVLDGDAFEILVNRLGYRMFREKRKLTEKYKKGRLVIEKVEISDLGKFLEIEILVQKEAEIEEAEKEVFSLLKDLGLEGKIEKRPYLAILK
jgi:predicted adenylyl cyclase CyaB